MYYVYVLTSEQGDFYIGCTGDLRKRLHKHNAGEVKSTRGKK
jgi:putative endonuclease